jgi:hypothetical protein
MASGAMSGPLNDPQRLTALAWSELNASSTSF